VRLPTEMDIGPENSGFGTPESNLIASQMTREVVTSQWMNSQTQQSLRGFHEDRDLEFLNSFLIWSNAFLSCGLHFCDIATGESKSSEKKHSKTDPPNIVAIFVLGVCLFGKVGWRVLISIYRIVSGW